MAQIFKYAFVGCLLLVCSPVLVAAGAAAVIGYGVFHGILVARYAPADFASRVVRTRRGYFTAAA